MERVRRTCATRSLSLSTGLPFAQACSTPTPTTWRSAAAGRCGGTVQAAPDLQRFGLMVLWQHAVQQAGRFTTLVFLQGIAVEPTASEYPKLEANRGGSTTVRLAGWCFWHDVTVAWVQAQQHLVNTRRARGLPLCALRIAFNMANDLSCIVFDTIAQVRGAVCRTNGWQDFTDVTIRGAWTGWSGFEETFSQAHRQQVLAGTRVTLFDHVQTLECRTTICVPISRSRKQTATHLNKHIWENCFCCLLVAGKSMLGSR